MTGTKRRWATLAAALPLAVGVLAIQSGGSISGTGGPTVARAASLHLSTMQMRLLSGTSEQALTALGALGPQAAGHAGAKTSGRSDIANGAAGTHTGGPVSATAGSIFPNASGSCETHSGSNVRVNTACTNYADTDLNGRSMAQNETAIAVSPTNPKNVIASANDYMRGDGNCGSYYSLNGGQTWNGTTAPMLFVRGSSLTPASSNAREYWQAGGDTTVAFDSKGTAFLQCQVFNRGAGTTQDPDVSSGVLIFRSANGGASWDFPGRLAVSSFEPNGTFPNGVVLHDKPLFTIDNRVGSPFQDRLYVTWTLFATDGSAYIYEVHSADGGETWSSPVVVSTTSAACTNTFGVPTAQGTCNENQFSDPFVGSDGSLYVAYDNYNNQPLSGTGNQYQVLLAKSTNGGVSFSAPVKVSNFYDLPDCATYTGQDAGRSCVVDKSSIQNSFFRATNYPSGAVDPTNASHVVIDFGSYINKNSNESGGCVPNGFSVFGNPLYTGATTVCNNQILRATSTDGGATFPAGTDPRTLPTVAVQKHVADEFWQWTGFTSSGVAVAGFYDRQYGTDETSGASDYSAAWAAHVLRVTTSSLPPPSEFAGAFNGDYNTLAVSRSTAHFTWTDTRNPGATSCPGNPDAICAFGNDEDDYTASVLLGP
ncbi:MAG TPA: sialidase family protein [Candidatus Saccharimonadales bacterium]|nr:sialidase family protein [Candidatus Saccharimonadales bacterium]